MLAVLTISAMVWTIANTRLTVDTESSCRNLVKPLLVLTFLQLIVAGMMSGMRAGLYYPTWPDMNGAFIPEVLLDPDNWTWHNLTNYDSYLFAPALIQFLHRILAYVLLIVTYYLFFNFRKTPEKIEKTWLTSEFRSYKPSGTAGYSYLILYSGCFYSCLFWCSSPIGRFTFLYKSAISFLWTQKTKTHKIKKATQR